MDEAYVVLVASRTDAVCNAFPFATKAGAEKAAEWFKGVADLRTAVIDDHEREGE